MFANVWMGVREEAHNAIVTRLRWDEESQGQYSGPVTDREYRVFRYMVDQANVERLFKKSRIVGKNWSLWNLIFTKKLQQVKIELDQLLADRPNHITIGGAWQWDGRQFGTEFVYGDVTRQINDPVFNQTMVPNPAYDPDPDTAPEEPLEILDPDWVAPDPWPQIDVTISEIVGTSGTPIYPIPVNALLKFMPDIITYDADGNELSRVAATVLTDVNLLQGQQERRFE